jgi:hypothetical protein
MKIFHYDNTGETGALTIVGIIILVIGVVLLPFTCFLSIIGVIIGIILIVIDIDSDKPPYPYGYYRPPPPLYYPPPQPPPMYYPHQPIEPGRSCPQCGREIPFHAIICPYCTYDFKKKKSKQKRKPPLKSDESK